MRDWQDAVVVPIPKKGDLKQCHHWCGIGLLDVQERTWLCRHDFYCQTACGEREGTWRVIVCVVYRLEEGLSFSAQASPMEGPREVWCARKMLNIVKSFHGVMHAEVRVGLTVTDRFEIRNSLWQGCTLAPTLFNIYFSAMVADWHNRSSGAGVSVLYKHGRKLVGGCTAKSRLSEMRVTESQFADDVAMYATSGDSFESVAAEFVKVVSEWPDCEY